MFWLIIAIIVYFLTWFFRAQEHEKLLDVASKIRKKKKYDF